MTIGSPKEGDGDWDMAANEVCVWEAAFYPVCTKESSLVVDSILAWKDLSFHYTFALALQL